MNGNEIIATATGVWLLGLIVIAVKAWRKRNRQKKIDRLKLVINYQTDAEDW